MGKSLNGKELGKGISQRKEDGLYVARFTNRFGKRQVIYDNTYNGIQKKMREAQYANEKAINVISTNMTLDEWYEKWLNTCKKNCRANTKETYARHYKRVQDDLGWRKLNLIVMQDAINKLRTDNERRNSKKILVDMLEKAVNADLVQKNVAKNNRPTTQFLISECIEGTMKRIHKNHPDLVFEKITPHCFRHTFATRYLEAGVPLKTVSALLGHTQLQLTTDLYMHVTQDSLFDGVAQYEKVAVG